MCFGDHMIICPYAISVYLNISGPTIFVWFMRYDLSHMYISGNLATYS